MEHVTSLASRLADRSAYVRDQIIYARRDRLLIDYAYQQGDAMINVRAPRHAICHSLFQALQFDLRRTLGRLQQPRDAQLSSAYCYWFNIVGLTVDDMRRTWIRSK